jgi:hypothetical protein
MGVWYSAHSSRALSSRALSTQEQKNFHYEGSDYNHMQSNTPLPSRCISGVSPENFGDELTESLLFLCSSGP